MTNTQTIEDLEKGLFCPTASDAAVTAALDGNMLIPRAPEQVEEINGLCQAYPHLRDDRFVQEHLDEWLS